MMHNFVLLLWKFDLEALKFFSGLWQYFNPNSKSWSTVGIGVCWGGLKWERGMVPLIASGLLWLYVQCVRSSRGWGGWKHVWSLPTHAQTQFLPDTCLQPGADQLCKKGSALVPPENVTPAVCPTMGSEMLAWFANAVNSANAAVITAKDCWLFEAPQESQNMSFPLSAASKAQVSQIYFPCKLLLHN